MANEVVVSRPRVIMPAPEKPADAEKRKRIRDAHVSDDAAPPQDDESDSEPLIKRVKVAVKTSRRGERRAPVIRGAKQNNQVCDFCRRNKYSCWRQGGRHPRGSCFECASHKQKCGDTDLNWAAMQHEKTLEKLEMRQKAKGQQVVKPVSARPVEPAKSTTSAPKTKAPAPVAGPSKPKKVPKSRAEISTTDEESEVPVKGKGKGKAVSRPSPIVLTSGSELVSAPSRKGTFRGMSCPQFGHF